MLVERDILVPTRAGFDIFVDIFRSLDESHDSPPLIAWTPYGKHDPAPLHKIYPTAGVEEGWISDYAIFEAPDPMYWVPRGFAVIFADVPGLWYANTPAFLMAPEEDAAYYDLIEWAGVQSWSNGRVGLSGVSYLSVSQWRVAALRPPHLAAINPYEGWSDTYREIVRHGGIPETSFWPYIQTRWGASDHQIEDLWRETEEHPLFDAFWASKAAVLSAIEVPAYVVASWSDHGMHTRGTLEGFKKIASKQKWLEVHGRKKWYYYYHPDSVERQKEFFDYFLKGSSPAPDWPRVRVEVRNANGSGTEKTGADWPMAAQYRPLYLNAQDGSLREVAPGEAGVARYDSLADGGQAHFDLRFDAPAEIVGHMKLKVFAVTADTDMDLFVAVQKLNVRGEHVGFTHFSIWEEGPVALGWLRASHRELDIAASTEYQPVLAHRRVLPVRPGEVAELDIEILPSATRFERGETLRLVIKGRDVYNFPKPMVYGRHEVTVNRGGHEIHTGAARASYLLVPFVDLT
jgi:uncharacterized protein